MKLFEILPDVKIAGLTLFLAKEDTIVFSDTHLGYEECLNKQGVMVPKFQYKEIISHLKDVLKETKPERIVINGDLKHEFGTISEQEWSEVLRFLDFLKDYEVILVKGNHDTILGPIAEKKNVKVFEECRIGEFLIIHGNKIPSGESLKGIKSIIMGHDHPAIGLSEEGRIEKVKCFLVGKWRKKNLIVLPSLSFVTEGVDVLKERLLSPMLEDVSGFNAICIEGGEIMDFGRIGDIKLEDDI